ncbi:MAG: hypothetical protein JKY70_08420, partial [Mucilaginibacter sp.]|nr:hypothetical protein [Mucilaginibacter sp.]
ASATLKPNIIFKIGKIIRHDFSNEFPEFFTSEDFAQQVTPAPKFNLGSEINDDDAIYKAKYIALLEKYNELLVEAVNAA